jgi:hypothetical protein
MNFIETIYCSQYYELKKSGRDPRKARLNGTLLSAAVILLGGAALVVVINHFTPGRFFQSFSGHMEGVASGKAIGRLLGLFGILVVGGILNFTYGSQARYERMMAEWEQLPEHVVAGTLKKSLKIFFIAFGAFLAVMALSYV